MTKQRYAGVPKRFDDHLEALIAFVAQHGSTNIVNVDELNADLVSQRTDTQRRMELARQAAGFHESFMSEQAARYARFMKALRMLRTAHADDPNARRALEQFKRRTRRSGSSSAADSEAA